MSKKLINNPVDAVDEALAGLVASYPGLTLLKGHRVIVRADVEVVTNQGKVSEFYDQNHCIETHACSY